MRERRRDPLSGQWRTYAAHRQDRTFLPSDQECPLCPSAPGRPATEIDEPAFDIVVFDNRFPSFAADAPEVSRADDLFAVGPALGAAEVVVYCDRHQATFADLGRDRIARLIDVWAERYADLGARDDVGYVFIFENKGEAIGVTLSHPHGQIYAYPDVPPSIQDELEAGAAHLVAHGTCVVCDIVARERQDGVRVVARNRSFLAYVPFAARLPYEMHVTSTRHAASLLDLSDPERDDLAAMLEVVTRTYDRLFGFSLPYVMGLHQAPTDEGRWQAVSHFHVEFTPIHRSATKLKYLAGSELSAGAFISDVMPEQAASELRGALDHPDLQGAT